MSLVAMEHLPSIGQSKRNFDGSLDRNQSQRVFATYCYLRWAIIKNDIELLAVKRGGERLLRRRSVEYQSQLNDISIEMLRGNDNIKNQVDSLIRQVAYIDAQKIPLTSKSIAKANSYFANYILAYNGLTRTLRTRYTKRAGIAPSRFILPNPEVLKNKHISIKFKLQLKNLRSEIES